MKTADRRRPDRLRPSLLDRLTDNAPRETHEPLDGWALTGAELRRAVRRDVAWLLNTTNIPGPTEAPADRDIARSVIHYGIPDLAGRCASSVDPVELASELRSAIERFEPRLVPTSVRVTHVPERKLHPNALCFLIEADLRSEPVPLPLRLRTELNLESGEASVTEAEAE